MKLLVVAAMLGLATPAFPQTQSTLWYDIIYGQLENPLTSVACSNGENGLIAKGYNTFGDIPAWPFIGGAPQIQSWDSPNCGTCWELMYTDANGHSMFLYFLAINTARPQGGFSISLEGMNYLTNNNGLALDGLSITAMQMSTGWCGGSD